MALAVQLAGTEGRTGEAMHPFFASIKDRSITKPDDFAPTSLPTGTDDDPIIIEQSAERPQNGSESRPLAGKRRKSRTETQQATSNQLPHKSSLSPPLDTTGSGKSQADSDGNRIQDRKNVQESPSSRYNAGRESNGDRRKRRRTDSPVPSGTPDSGHIMNWEEQLLFAGFVESSPKPKQQESPIPPHRRQDPTEVTKDSEETEDQERISLSTSTTLEKEIQGHTDAEPLQSANSPQRVMRLRNDGKLGSLRHKDGTDKTKRKTKPKEGSSKKNKRALVIKYGADLQTRIRMGKKINSILSRARSRTPAPVSKPLPSRASNPAVVPKTTHPFFLSKVNQMLEAEASNPSTRGRSRSKGRSRGGTVSPRKVSGGKGSNDVKSWNDLAGSVNFSKAPKFPGAIAPLWPPRDTMHVRGHPEFDPPVEMTFMFSDARKLKNRRINLGRDDNVLDSFEASKVDHDLKSFRKPIRQLVTGPQLQDILRKRIFSRISGPLGSMQDPVNRSSLSLLPGSSALTHYAIAKLFNGLASSLSPFDNFAYEDQDWIHKYAPTCIAEVLQPDDKLSNLRDWLISLTVSTVESGSSAPKIVPKAKAKKRRRTDELDNFIVGSDDESEYVDEVTEPEDEEFSASYIFGASKSTKSPKSRVTLRRLSPEAIKTTKAVVVSGPHGCGKTASIYAVAKELGFEVFEINSGSRRNGKDIMDKVGDMTKNHLVRQIPDAEDPPEGEPNLASGVQEEVESGRQSTMQSFFQPKPSAKTNGKAMPKQAKKAAPQKPPESPKKTRKQKQSLILLEEVDVLFEEDKQFWGTIMSLLASSKRPIIMTCTDESRLPQDDMKGCSVLRLKTPPEVHAVDFLLLLAANEGHLLSREALSTLYASKKGDLRSSIMHLNFWCQMAIGDCKGGLEWMLLANNNTKLIDGIPQRLRVISEATFHGHDGLFSHNTVPDTSTSITQQQRQDVDLLSEAVHNYDYDVEDWTDFAKDQIFINQDALKTSYDTIRELELGIDALSAADTLPGSGFLDPKYARMETSEFEIPDKVRCNFIEGFRLLHAEPLQDQSYLSEDIVLTLKLQAGKSLLSSCDGKKLLDIEVHALCDKLLSKPRTLDDHRHIVQNTISSAFSPLAVFQNNLMQPKGPTITSLDSGTMELATDIAPYVRSIVSYDMKLEAQRLQMSNLLSQGGRKGKKQRTTRSSLAALEGGSKANTRRERWFPNSLNFNLVMETGGYGWGDAVAKVQGKTHTDEASTDVDMTDASDTMDT